MRRWSTERTSVRADALSSSQYGTSLPMIVPLRVAPPPRRTGRRATRAWISPCTVVGMASARCPLALPVGSDRHTSSRNSGFPPDRRWIAAETPMSSDRGSSVRIARVDFSWVKGSSASRGAAESRMSSGSISRDPRMHEHRRARHRAKDDAERFLRRVVSPLPVVEDEDDRPARRDAREEPSRAPVRSRAARASTGERAPCLRYRARPRARGAGGTRADAPGGKRRSPRAPRAADRPSCPPRALRRRGATDGAPAQRAEGALGCWRTSRIDPAKTAVVSGASVAGRRHRAAGSCRCPPIP